MGESFLNGRVLLHSGNCLDVLARLAECSVDSCVTDPPYHLTSIVQRFGAENAAPAQFGSDGRYACASAGFMGKVWDGGDVAFRPETWRAVWRVLKPGGHLLAMGGTRTYHQLACAIEDAGFEIRDTISWLYGSGFPKSLDVSKGIDRVAGAVREIIKQGRSGSTRESYNGTNAGRSKDFLSGIRYETMPSTDAARQWQGWGTALKPACELIVLARKPLSEGTVAANVLRWGTGAINIAACRIGTETIRSSGDAAADLNGRRFIHGTRPRDYEADKEPSTHIGRWPANVAHDGSAEVVARFPESGPASSGGVAWQKDGYVGGKYEPIERTGYDDAGGSAARFFYTAKADADDRLGSKHPTVKPLDLMQWLVRLVTPKGGTVLDPFAGTGTTAEAAWREGMRAMLIEAEPEYQADIRRRMALVMSGPDERSRESIKAKNLPVDYGPLFGFPEAAE